jgi:flagellar hook-basal body complex protein FliE
MNITPLSLTAPSAAPLSVSPGIGKAAAGAPGGSSFGELLSGMVNKLDGMQDAANNSVSDVIAGKETNVHQVAMKVQEAGVAFDLMLGVRNRLMDAYNELVKMQV